jgi:Kef-type K+ transport system membrane component KefB
VTASQLAVAFFLQMFVILAACRLVGMAARRLGQPQVVGEMVAGVLIGPSLLGLVWPALQQWVFPGESMKVLYVGAQLGIGLYMFLVGAGFKHELFRSRMRSALAVSLSGMVVPFALAAVLALWLRSVPGLFAERATTWQAILFLGAAMAITAFPMLARIIHERGLTGTALGTLALAAGCIDDAAAWCVLAVVLATFSGGGLAALQTVLGGALYALIVLTVGRRLLARLETAVQRADGVTPGVLSVVLMLFMVGSWITDTIGIHTVFGGFILGVALPRGRLTLELTRQLEPFAVVFLLPMFFTFSGLNTRLDMIDSPLLLLIALSVLVVACLGKGVACWAAARWNGDDQRTALAVGTLMNARGMMELILVNIGLQHGIIQTPLFSVLVLMAIVTTLMAPPVFELVYGRHTRAGLPADAAPASPARS